MKSILNNINQNSRSKNALKQIIFSFVFKAINIIIGILYVPLLLNYLNQEKYGIWLILTSILGWFSFFDIGLGNGLRNKLTESIAQNDYIIGKKYVSTTYLLLTLIFGSVLVIFYISNHFLDWNKILNSYSLSKHELYLLTTIVFSFFFIRFVVQIIQVIYLSYQRSSFSDIINCIGNVISFFVIFVLVKTSYSGNLILLGSIISIIPVVLFIIVSIYAFNTVFKEIKPSIKFIELKYSRDLLGLGFQFFFLQVCSIIIFSTSNFFITQFYGAKEVTIYNIAFKLFQMPIMVFNIILSPMWSAITDAYIKNDYNWLNGLMKKLNIMSLIFSLGIVILLFISPWVYKLWLGNKVVIPFTLSCIMALYSIFTIFVSPYNNFINGTSKIRLTMYLTGFGIILYLSLVFLFKNLFNDSTGIILAIAITSLIGVIMQPLQTFYILKGKSNGIWNK